MMNGLFGVCILCWSSTEMAGVCFEWIMRMPLSFSPKWISYILQTITMSSYLMYHNKQTCYQIFVIIFMGTICKQNNIDSIFSFSAYPPNEILSRSTFHLLSYDESGLFFSFAIIFDLHTLIPNWIVSFKLFHNSEKKNSNIAIVSKPIKMYRSDGFIVIEIAPVIDCLENHVIFMYRVLNAMVHQLSTNQNF